MTDKTSKQIAGNLRKSRRKLGLTQAELAEKAGVNPNYYSRIERGEVRPSVEILHRVIKALGAKSSDILPF